MKSILLNFLLQLLFFNNIIVAQDQQKTNEFIKNWIILQSMPNLTLISFPTQTNFALEWEIAPIIYSFGMNKLDPPIHFFIVTPTERFAGSIELNLSTQLFLRKAGKSHWGFSGQLITHLPLIEYGEYLGLNLGIARYTNSLKPANFIVGGISTLFGFLHYNIRYSYQSKIWMHSIEFRFF